MKLGDAHERPVMGPRQVGMEQPGLPVGGRCGGDDARNERRGGRLFTQCVNNWCRVRRRPPRSARRRTNRRRSGFFTQCVKNPAAGQLGIGEVKLAAKIQRQLAIPTPAALLQLDGEIGDHSLAIASASGPVLLLLHDLAADEPVGHDLGAVYRAGRLGLRGVEDDLHAVKNGGGGWFQLLHNGVAGRAYSGRIPRVQMIWGSRSPAARRRVRRTTACLLIGSACGRGLSASRSTTCGRRLRARLSQRRDMVISGQDSLGGLRARGSLDGRSSCIPRTTRPHRNWSDRAASKFPSGFGARDRGTRGNWSLAKTSRVCNSPGAAR